MSGALTAFSAAGFARSLVTSILTRNSRQIIWPLTDQKGAPIINKDGQQLANGIGGYVAIIEDHRDELQITEHPVQQGATIADHAYKEPAHLTLQIGWTTSSAIASGLPTLLGIVPIPTLAGFFGQGNSDYIKQVYQQMLQLQAQRTLLIVYTGKRIYRNMLLRGISERTVKETENSLTLVCSLKEIIIASVQTVQVPTNAAAQAQPQDTSPTQNQGQQQLQQAPNYNSASA